MFRNPFSFRGRILRTEYNISLIIAVITYALILPIARTSVGEWQLLSLFFVPLLWFVVAQTTKRCHDRGHSGWWQLIPFYFVQLIFNKGNKDANEYGGGDSENS